MAHAKALIFVVITLISTKIASSFPAEYEPESSLGANHHDRMERVRYQQSYDQDLLSILPCETAAIDPSSDHMYSYTTEIVYEMDLQQFVCYATFKEMKAIQHKSGLYIIEHIFLTNSYPKDHLYKYNVNCQPNQVVIEEIYVNLQEPIPYHDQNYCVDYVEIKPPLNNHPHAVRYCGCETCDDGPYSLSESNKSNVEVVFRTSSRNNKYPGFSIRLRCDGGLLQEEEDLLLKFLQLPSKSSKGNQQYGTIQFDSLDKLVNFASHQCKSATTLSISSHWSIVQLALQNEEADEEEMQKAAQDVLQCFPPSQITFARIAMAESYK